MYFFAFFQLGKATVIFLLYFYYIELYFNCTGKVQEFFICSEQHQSTNTSIFVTWKSVP